MLNYFRLNFSSHAFYGGLFCHERSWGVRGRGNERKIRLLTFSSSSNRCALMKFYSYGTARSPESDRGGNCQLGCKPGVTVTLAIWGCSCHNLELSFIKLFFGGDSYMCYFVLTSTLKEDACSHFFFRWRHFVLLGLDQSASVTWRFCG